MLFLSHAKQQQMLEFLQFVWPTSGDYGYWVQLYIWKFIDEFVFF